MELGATLCPAPVFLLVIISYGMWFPSGEGPRGWIHPFRCWSLPCLWLSQKIPLHLEFSPCLL